MVATFYKNIFETKNPSHDGVDVLLERVKNGNSKQLIEEIRNTIDKSKKDALKKNLPSIVFSGKYENREDKK